MKAVSAINSLTPELENDLALAMVDRRKADRLSRDQARELIQLVYRVFYRDCLEQSSNAGSDALSSGPLIH